MTLEGRMKAAWGWLCGRNYLPSRWLTPCIPLVCPLYYTRLTVAGDCPANCLRALVFSPQATTVPLRLSARLWLPPALPGTVGAPSHDPVISKNRQVVRSPGGDGDRIGHRRRRVALARSVVAPKTGKWDFPPFSCLQRANRIIAEELARRGWQESELATLRLGRPSASILAIYKCCGCPPIAAAGKTSDLRWSVG